MEQGRPGVIGLGDTGAGRDARFRSFLRRYDTLRGGRFVVRRPVADAVASTVERLVAAGFVAREDGLDDGLREAGSPWTARAVEIGDPDRSRGREWVADLIKDTPLDWVLQRKISHTLVVVAARDLGGGTTELDVFPHMSATGIPSGAAGAEGRLRTVLAAIQSAGTADGALVSYTRSMGIPNDGSPASQEMVRTLLGWR